MEMETYLERYARLGSHELARKELRREAEAMREREVRVAELRAHQRDVRVETRKFERRVGTDGPFRLQNIVEKAQPDVHAHLRRAAGRKAAARAPIAASKGALSPRSRPRLGNNQEEDIAAQKEQGQVEEEAQDVADHVAALVRQSFHSQVLAIQWKQLTRFPEQIENTLSKQLNHVHTIKLKGNRFRRLPTWSKHAYRCLRELNVSNNKLEELPSNLDSFQTLEVLVLKYNKLSALPSSICKLSRLRILELDGNQLEELPKDVGKLADSLEILRLEENHIVLLPWSMQKLTKLHTLTLGRNAVQCLAFFAPLRLRDDGYRAQDLAKVWETRTLPGADGPVFYNRETGEVRKRPPQGIEESDPWADTIEGDAPSGKAKVQTSSLEHEGGKVPELALERLDATQEKIRRVKVISRRKAALARQGKSIWTCEVDFSSGVQLFRNNIFRTTQSAMPADLDYFGCLHGLQVLSLRNNKLTELPSSFGQLVQLRELYVEANQLREIPLFLANLVKLEVLDMSDNFLVEVPAFIKVFRDLRKLMLHRNNISQVSPKLAELAQLEKLWLMNNRLGPGSLPAALHKLKRLSDLQLGDNPVVLLHGQMPQRVSKGPIQEVARYALERKCVAQRELTPMPMYQNSRGSVGGLTPKREPERYAALSWHFREQELIERHGVPPKSRTVAFGISGERQVSNFEFAKEEQGLIQNALRTGQLALHWRSLTRIPEAVFRLRASLRELRLVGNHITQLPSEIGLLSKLRILELRKNHMRSICSNISVLSELEHLLLEDNELESLPEEIGSLGSLRELSVNGNSLTELPPSIGKMQKLEKLFANVNRLTALPDEMEDMKALREVHISSNKVEDFPVCLAQIASLQVLHLNLNRIEFLPSQLSLCPNLKTLHLASNQLREVPASVCSGSLAQSLESLWLYSNKIVQLPDAFAKLEALRDLRVDFNQMISPPESFVLKKGPEGARWYCAERAKRMRETEAKLLEADFEIDVCALRPKVKDVLTGKTGFLTTPMIRQFECDLDLYLNGPFYDHPDKQGSSIIQALVKAKEAQRHLFLDTVLRQFLVVMELLQSDKAVCSHYFFNPRVKRRAGVHGQVLQYYAMDLNAMFEDQSDPCPQQAVVRKLEMREENEHGGLVRFREIEFQGERFVLERQVLEDALDAFEDPFHGRVTFSSAKVCFKGRGGHRTPRAAAMIPKLIFTVEEAERCRAESRYLKMMLEEVERNHSEWIESEACKAKIKVELKRRRRQAKRKLALSEVDTQYAKKAIKEARSDLLEAETRLKRFRKGAAKIQHGLDSEEEGRAEVAKATQAFKDAEQGLVQVKENIKRLKAVLKEKPAVLESECTADLKNKLLERERKFILLQGRKHARAQGLRRPWDGPNGDMFIMWSRYLDSIARERSDIEEETASNNRRRKLDPETAELEAKALKEALQGVEEREQEIERVSELHEHEPGWSSDESDAEPLEDPFDTDLTASVSLNHALPPTTEGAEGGKSVPMGASFATRLSTSEALVETDGEFTTSSESSPASASDDSFSSEEDSTFGTEARPGDRDDRGLLLRKRSLNVSNEGSSTSHGDDERSGNNDSYDEGNRKGKNSAKTKATTQTKTTIEIMQTGL
ncbi:Leucine-rich repeat and death domain-containing protein 1 [Durusdinium trenchii]|uniref:Leucine-rich repeat and death domain-containing protein 1 n=1 Tax=Durusdinium trenchii TaxID=1381693 RepID=A0ABP0RRG2_9DINO